jgi:hypothetical protein
MTVGNVFLPSRAARILSMTAELAMMKSVGKVGAIGPPWNLC